METDKIIECLDKSHHFKGLLQEFLSSYVLFGYDINNNYIMSYSLTNEKDKDALLYSSKILKKELKMLIEELDDEHTATQE